MKPLISFKYGFLIFKVFVFASLSYGANILDLKTLDEPLDNLYVLEDPNSSLTIETVSSGDFVEKFKPVSPETIPLKDGISSYWVKFTIRSGLDLREEWVLDFQHWTKVNLYYRKSGSPFNEKRTGHKLPFNERDYPVGNRNYILIPLNAGEEFECYAHLEYKYDGFNHPMVFEVRANQRNVLDNVNSTRRLVIGIFLSIYLIMFLYNLFLYFSTKDKDYIYYLVLVFLFMFLAANNSGYLLSILSGIKSYPEWRVQLEIFIVGGMGVAAMAFTHKFLHTKEHFPFWSKLMLWLIALSVVGVVLRFVVPLFGDVFTNLVSLGILAWTAIVGIKSYRAGLPSSGFFLVAFAFSIVGSFILIFSLIGVLPKNDLTLFYSMPGGSMVEMVLFSFALGNKLNILRKENEDSQERIMDQLRLNEALQTKVNRELELKVAERTIEVRAEKEKSDGLLLNILPAAIAEELKQKGVATPRSYDNVSILFTDFKGFSTKASKMTAEELVQQLDYCFRAFDEIIERNGLEKIKTIGDAYMCAGGVPIASENHAPRTVKTGLEMQEFMVKWGEEMKKMGKDPWELRIGINTGPVVAGVVGKRKFAYDIWGATVNLAARLESSGAVGRVNISRSTYDMVKDKYQCTHRGKIAAKDIGEVDMFFIDASV